MIARKESKGSLAKIFACCIPLALVIAMATATAAFADDRQSIDVISGGDDDLTIQFGKDTIWAGLENTFADATYENDLLAAGQTINVSNAEAKGSIRAAGQYVRIDDCEVGQSITIAGQSVSMDGGSASCAALVGADASFSGECDSLAMSAGTVRIDGTVHGDVTIGCDKIEIGPNAVIEGTLKGEAGAEPVIASGAEVAAQSITINPDNSNDSGVLDGVSPARVLGFAIGAAAVAAILSLGVFILIAMLCEWLARRHTDEAARMIKLRTAPQIVSGLVGMLLVIPAVILLCLPIVTLPIAGALGLVVAAIGLVGANFMAASLSRLAFPNMGRIKRVALFALILGGIGLVPFIGGLLRLAGFVFLLGYVIQRIWIGMKEADAAGSIPTPPGAGPEACAYATAPIPPTPVTAPVTAPVTTEAAPSACPVPPAPPTAPQQTQCPEADSKSDSDRL